MQDNNPFMQETNVYTDAFTDSYLQDMPYEELDLDIDDDKLDKMLITSLEADRDYWDKKPFELKRTDLENTAFLLGDQLSDREFLKNDTKYVDNRLLSSVRAILSYATGQLAKPDITPSKGDEIYLKGARDLGSALYQHAADNKVEFKVRAATMNLLSRKRGFLKLRFDPDAGVDGDIVTEVCNPEDIVISRTAEYLGNPDKIYHRIGCTIDELISRFPQKKTEILEAYSIRRGVYTQMSRYVYYYECWFTYKRRKNPAGEGVCWFIPEKHLILDKMKNPNWVEAKDIKKEKEANITNRPPKPFIIFNYLNTGRSYIDETSLVDQAKPMQEMLNKRGRQIWENADYVNGRWIADKNAFSQEDAHKIVNKGARTVALADMTSVANPLVNVASAALPSYVENTLYDARGEIDQLMGTPSVFKGAAPESQNTLGRDLLLKQQAGALQDDLVRCISLSMEEYYKLLAQMMRVYYTDDYWFQCKGGDGKYEFILINGDAMDTNVKISVQTDSTLPLDKAQIRSTAMSLWQAGQSIDYKTLMEDLGLPNPDIRAERYLKNKLDPINYLRSIETSQIDDEAESDIMLLIANKIPEERDDYSQEYVDYYNKYVASNRFDKLRGKDPKAAQRVIAYLVAVQHIMQKSAALQSLIQPLDNANMIPMQPPQPPMPVMPQGQPQGTPEGIPPVVPNAPDVSGVQPQEAPTPPMA